MSLQALHGFKLCELPTHDHWYHSLVWEIMASSVTMLATLNDKDVMALVEEMLIKIKNSMSTLMGRVNNIDKHIEELEPERDMEEL